MDKIQNLLQQVSIIQKKYDEIAKITGENFNIFSILSMERREVKTHSAFLGELLNPKGSHGLNDLFLKLFIKEVFKESLDEFETSFANTITEEYIAQINEDKTKGGRVDIVVKDTKGNVILIENKIDAYEQQNQLIRYRNAYPKAKILFLTLVGHDSNTALDIVSNQKDYISISYEKQIVQWLEVCLKEAVNHPMLREAIKQYVYLIKKITNQTSNNQMSEEIVESMKTNIVSSFEISKNIKNLKSNLYYEFMGYIKEYALKNEMAINTAWEKKDSEFGLFLKPNSWRNDFFEIAVIFASKNYEGLYVGVSFMPELNEEHKNKVRKVFNENGFQENNWWIWKNTSNASWKDNAEIWDSLATKGKNSKEYKEIIERIEEILKVYDSMSN